MIDRQTAQADFDRFVESNDIDLENSDEDSKGDIRKIIRAIMIGKLVINDNGLPELILRNGNIVKFKEPTGAMYVAMDKGGKNEDMKKIFLSLAAVTGESVATYVNMGTKDIGIIMSLWKFFLDL